MRFMHLLKESNPQSEVIDMVPVGDLGLVIDLNMYSVGMMFRFYHDSITHPDQDCLLLVQWANRILPQFENERGMILTDGESFMVVERGIAMIYHEAGVEGGICVKVDEYRESHSDYYPGKREIDDALALYLEKQ